MAGVQLGTEEAEAAFSAWNELWFGMGLAHDRFMRIDLQRNVGESRWTLHAD